MPTNKKKIPLLFSWSFFKNLMWNPSGALISKSGFKDINEYFDKLEQWKSVTGLRLSRFGVCDFLVLLILDCLDLECQLLVLYRFNSI